jgi:hypothetical protein
VAERNLDRSVDSVSDQKPTVCRMVHFVSYGTPACESGCQAAVITETTTWDTVGLAVLSPFGATFVRTIAHDEAGKAAGTWHWPERTDSGA